MQLVINGKPTAINPRLGLSALYEIVEKLEKEFGFKTVKTETIISLTKGK